MRFGRCPYQLPAHRRLTRWVIDISAPQMRGVGGCRGPAPSGWGNLPSPHPVPVGMFGGVQCQDYPLTLRPVRIHWGGGLGFCTLYPNFGQGFPSFFDCMRWGGCLPARGSLASGGIYPRGGGNRILSRGYPLLGQVLRVTGPLIPGIPLYCA